MKVYYEYKIYNTYAAELEIDDNLIEVIECATGLKVTEEQIEDIINKEPHDRTLRDIGILNAIQDYMCDEIRFKLVDSYETDATLEVEED